MNTYKVTTDNLSGHQAGDTVTEQDLEGVNIDALIEGGHITPTTKTKKAED